ncbi:TRAP transporter small permease subunit [Mesorhizobium sp. J18]|uniref:TRAP transporter small permease n=1 Tax=Mesorhizobium sp. J18 TaxID=935263 RepID=UPI00164504C5|nr:TRAP transporter small permease subunit [Mesorhizobium sp. J18]
MTARISMFLACLSLAALTALFVAIIALRFAGISIPSADEIAGILLGGTLALGFAAAVPKDQHIAVDFFVDKLGTKGAAAARALAAVIMIAIIFYLLIGFSRMWYTAWLSGITMLGHLPIPRWVPMGVVLLGLIMLEISLVLRFLQRVISEGFGPAKHDFLEGEL